MSSIVTLEDRVKLLEERFDNLFRPAETSRSAKEKLFKYFNEISKKNICIINGSIRYSFSNEEMSELDDRILAAIVEAENK